MRRTRPALIVQDEIANRHSPITIVAAITSQFDEPLYLTEVLVRPPEGGVTIPSVVLLKQVRSIDKRRDKRRLVRRLGVLTPATMQRVDRAMLINLGLVGIYIAVLIYPHVLE
ncbi:MAG: type II toxin-antitoxin system PemK/MazF family toxin [Candidatus Tectomicrobia bacterium]|nr:type II toxin-antitoxin system PemK/MazF family toxin [Candidatus Tectomicrobia bacterium]